MAIARNIVLRRLGNRAAAADALKQAIVDATSFASRVLRVWQLSAEVRSGRYRGVVQSADDLILKSAASPRIMIMALGIKATAEQHEGLHEARNTWHTAWSLASAERLFAVLAAGQQTMLSELLAESPNSLPVEVNRFILSAPLAEEDSPLASLSPREHVVLEARLRGLTLEEVAQDLFISVNTVKTHLRRITAKIGTGTVNELRAAARSRQ